MASSFTTLGIEKMATGENAGTWGDKTNTNLDIVNTAISGYVEQAVTSGGTTALEYYRWSSYINSTKCCYKINRNYFRKLYCNCSRLSRKSLHCN